MMQRDQQPDGLKLSARRSCAGTAWRTRPRGIAISLILAAVALLAVMGALIAASTRLGSMLSSHNTDVADAMVLVNQMSNIREGMRLMVARGTPGEAISLDTNDGTTTSPGYAMNTVGLYHPTLGGTEPQVPPRRVFDATFMPPSSYYTWHLITDTNGNATVKLKNIGTAAGAERIIAIVGLRMPICMQINKLINGTSANVTPTKATGTVANDWGIRPSATLVDLSSSAGMDKLEQCFQTNDGNSVYYSVVKPG